MFLMVLVSLLCRYNFFAGCPETKTCTIILRGGAETKTCTIILRGAETKTCTIILRGGAEQFIAESERSIHDAIMIVRRAMKNDSVVAGGGAIEVCG